MHDFLKSGSGIFLSRRLDVTSDNTNRFARRAKINLALRLYAADVRGITRWLVLPVQLTES
jgi:hypothetical protein